MEPIKWEEMSKFDTNKERFLKKIIAQIRVWGYEIENLEKEEKEWKSKNTTDQPKGAASSDVSLQPLSLLEQLLLYKVPPIPSVPVGPISYTVGAFGIITNTDDPPEKQ